MRRQNSTIRYNVARDELSLIRNIYSSFEALEETMGALKMEEPLLMTYAAKKSFARIIMKSANPIHRLKN